MKRERLVPLCGWLAPLAFLAVFFFYPLTQILGLSLGRSSAGPAAPFIEALTAPGMRHTIAFTFWQAGLSTLLTLLVGLPGAYLVGRYRFPGKSLLLALTGIPFVLPTLVAAAAFNALLGPRGWINLLLMAAFKLPEAPIQFVNSLGAILTVHVFYNVTIVLRMVGDFLSHLDPRLGQAARLLGANRWQVLWQITLPLAAPAIAAAALLVFIFDFTSFGVILILGGPRFATLETEIYTQTISLFNLPLAAALSILQMTFTLGLSVLYTRLAQRLAQPLSLRPVQIAQRRLDSWRARLLAGLVVGLLSGLTLLPLLALTTRSLIRFETVRGRDAPAMTGFTLDFYRELNLNRRGSAFYTPPAASMFISIGYATLTVLLSLALGLPAAWLLARPTGPTSAPDIPLQRINRLMDPLLMLPLGTSAVTLGLGFLVALNRPPLDLRTSPLLIPLAHTLVAFPFVVRSLTPALRSIRPRLRQAAMLLGASPRQVLRQVDLPLVGRALLVAATFAFTISLGEFGATALIARPEYPTMPLVIYRLLSQPGTLNYGQALAMSTLLMLTTAGSLLLIERFRLADLGEF